MQTIYANLNCRGKKENLGDCLYSIITQLYSFPEPYLKSAQTTLVFICESCIIFSCDLLFSKHYLFIYTFSKLLYGNSQMHPTRTHEHHPEVDSCHIITSVMGGPWRREV